MSAQKIQTISGEYLYEVPKNVSLETAERTAVERARLDALAKVFGTTVSQVNTSSVENRNGQSDIAFLSSGFSEVKGEWLEDIKNPEIEIINEQGSLWIRVKVKGRAREIVHTGIDIDARILRNGTETRFESNEFRSGDDLFMYFRTPTDGYLAVYLIDAQQQAYCLLPYLQDATGNVPVRHDKEYIFFSSAHSSREKEIVDEYTLTCEQNSELNVLYIIFSPDEFIKPNDVQTDDSLPRNLHFADFQKWLTRNKLKDKSLTVLQKAITIKN